MWLPLLSNVTKAPEPGPDTETVAGAAVLAVARRVAVARGVAALVALLVPLARLGTAPLRTVVLPPLTASLCQVPTEAKFLSKVAEK